jgi:predicted metal-dependent hydrolase
LLEEYWKSTEDRDRIWVGLIQIAVGFYHFRRGNRVGAIKMLNRALRNSDYSIHTGLNTEDMHVAISEWISQIENGTTYFDPQLPIQDLRLINEGRDLAKKNGYHWGSHSDLSNMELIHRHSRRDRTDVIEARRESLVRKGRIAIND